MTLAINSPAARMRDMGQHVDGPTVPLAADPSLAAQERFVVQALTAGRWGQYCSSRDTLPEAQERKAAAELDRPELQFRIVRATTTFDVIA